MSKCMVHPGLSKQGFVEITIKGIRRYTSINLFKFKHNSIKRVK